MPLPDISEEEAKQYGVKQLSKKQSRSNEDYGEVTDANMNEYPFSLTGKLYFTNGAGKDNWCTAEFVGADNVLMTAAHCAYESGYSTNLLFDQQYSGGLYSKEYTINDIEVTDNWRDAMSMGYHDWEEDYAFLQTNEPNNDGHIGLDNFNTYTDVVAVGYPSNFDSGSVMKQVLGWIGESSHEPGTMAMNENPMRSGNSGGAWFAYKSGDAVGLNSYSKRGDSRTMYSPQITDKTVDLWRAAFNHPTDLKHAY